jgi:hypothetical protein
MALHQSTPSNSPTIDRPSCVICGERMWLSRITQDGPHHKRTFECPVCEISEDKLPGAGPFP